MNHTLQPAAGAIVHAGRHLIDLCRKLRVHGGYAIPKQPPCIRALRRRCSPRYLCQLLLYSGKRDDGAGDRAVPLGHGKGKIGVVLH